MKLPNLKQAAVLDWESLPITKRPLYPPQPVGLAERVGKAKAYKAFGHVMGGNDSSFEQVRQRVAELFDSGRPLLFHNAKFDCAVIEECLDLKVPWDRVHDTLPMLFLDDPRAPDFSLKPSAQRLLGDDPDERDAMMEWLIANAKLPGRKLGRAKGKNYAGAYVAWAPVDIAGPYAVGDVDRTYDLAQLLLPSLDERGMLEAYERERLLLPLVYGMERRGVRVDVERLGHDISMYRHTLQQLDNWLRKKLKVGPSMNLDSDDELTQALVKARLADASSLGVTKTGKLQANKEALSRGIKDKQVSSVLRYRAALSTCLGTFMEPWYAVACESGGLIYTEWHTTRNAAGEYGTKTGRLSSTPNFQNIPNEFPLLFRELVDDPEAKAKLPSWPLSTPAIELPFVRRYIIPLEKGHVLIDRDYCFSPDTEVLTEHGFVRFDQLRQGSRVAQWRDGTITYAYPLEYQVLPFQGDLVNIVGERSCDLLVTPSHRCLQLDAGIRPVFRHAKDYALRGAKQVGAGLLEGGEYLDEAYARLMAAVQADATVKSPDRLVWKLKKQRKRTRLRELFEALGFPYVEVPTTDGQVRVTLQGYCWNVHKLLSAGADKTFSRRWLGVSLEARRAFLRETAWWDGRRNGKKAWSFFSTNTENVELVCELAAVSGFRVNLHKQVLPSGKQFWTANMREEPNTWTDTYTKTPVQYDGLTYCVTMPHSTVVVRRNGKVMVTGQSQQEPRIAAHYEAGPLFQMYDEDPWADVHDRTQAIILEATGVLYKRKPVKNTGLGVLYGMGGDKLAYKNEMTVEEAVRLKNLVLKLVYPGIKEMYNEARQCAKSNQPVYTWGGREYYCEDPKVVNGRMMQFDYKLVNLRIQGSAADCTKEALIRYHNAKPAHHHCVLQVHDQIVSSVPKEDIHPGMRVLKETMESVEFSVPMLSEGKWTDTNWGDMKDYDTKGRQVYQPTKRKK